MDPTLGWFDVDYLGIDQGPIIGMIENYRTGLIWRLMRGNPHIVLGLSGRGLRGDGFRESVRPESARRQESRVNSRLGPARERAATPLQRQRRVAASAAAAALMAVPHLSAQASGARTYCNPLDIEYRYSLKQIDQKISYRAGAYPVIVNHKGAYYLFVTKDRKSVV